MVPSCPTAGELKMMSVVAFDHLSMPSCPARYSRPSCEPNATEPSSSSAGDEVIGPPVRNVQATWGFLGGITYGERPRCSGPNRNIVRAGSTAGLASAASTWGGGAVGTGLPVTSGPWGGVGHAQCPCSHTRACLQSLSEAQFVGSTWAQAVTASANHHSAAHGPPLATDV